MFPSLLCLILTGHHVQYVFSNTTIWIDKQTFYHYKSFAVTGSNIYPSKLEPFESRLPFIADLLF